MKFFYPGGAPHPMSERMLAQRSTRNSAGNACWRACGSATLPLACGRAARASTDMWRPVLIRGQYLGELATGESDPHRRTGTCDGEEGVGGGQGIC